MSDIVEEIWNLPESHVPVTVVDDSGSPVDPSAKIVLREALPTQACIDEPPIDDLFVAVDETLFDEPTFKTMIALFDNYTAVESHAANEFQELPLNDPTHGPEVDAFVDAVLPTKPVQTAKDFIQAELETSLSDADFRQRLRTIWFEPYTNKRGQHDHFATGFEHTFLGEDETSSGGGPRCEDAVGGYHSWVKYYLDQKAGKAAYYGCDYRNSIRDTALAWPQIATVLMRWSPTRDEDGAHGHPIMKIPGGFFVGTRPELEIAIGVVGMSLHKTVGWTSPGLDRNRRRVEFSGHVLHLTLHPESTSPNTRGHRLRTLWPAYKHPVDGRPDPGAGPGGGSSGGVNLPTQPVNNGPIRVVAVLPDPTGSDDGNEWVELKNITPDVTFDLSQWKLTDMLGRQEPLTGTITPGETKRITLTRSSQDSMMLRNSGPGWVVLFEGSERHAAVKYPHPTDGTVYRFDA